METAVGTLAGLMPVPIRSVRRFHGRRVLGWLAVGAVVQATGRTDSITILFWISMAALIESRRDRLPQRSPARA
jgi:uncharacterized membrane protein YhaH (DUF805 family)